MMSLHSPMHSSQRYTVGPAISFLTSFWALPQKEQVRDAPSRFSIGIGRSRGYRGSGPELLLLVGLLLRRHEHLVDQAIFLCGRPRHEVVTLGVVLDPLDGLAGVLRV